MLFETKNQTWYELFFKHRNVFLDAFLIAFSVAFMGIMANIRIPLWPVPITMQTFGIFMIAFFFGYLRGAIAIIAYLAAGLVGFGVFAGYSSGMAPFLGPTGGYLVGFVFMAMIIGWMIQNGYAKTRLRIALTMLAGSAVLYVFGLAGLWYYLKAPFTEVLMLGLVPFIVGDTLKAVGAIWLFPYVYKGAEKLNQ